MKKLFAITVLATSVSACVNNPVTGESEFSLVSESQELNIGKQNYSPLRQAQGGDYTVDKELTRYVQSVGNRLVKVSDRQLPYEFTVLNSSVPNAWALPGGKIAINRGLLTELNSEAELAAVLGHEIVHAAARHGAQSQTRGMLLQGGMVLGAIGLSNSKYAGESLLLGQLGAQLISTKYGRDAERESDLYGTRYMSKAGYNPDAAVELQQTFVRLSEGRKTSFTDGLFSSHPPSQERVENNKNTAASLPQGGEMGRAIYQQKIAHIKKMIPAYKAYDEGVKALKEKDYSTALNKAQQALKMEPNESRFHALRGDVRFGQKKYSDALTNYERALAKDNSYFAHWVERGMARYELGQKNPAQADFQTSLKLLPTPIAHQYLGQIAESNGNQAAAVKHYEQASQGNSLTARQSATSLARLDLPQRPSRYIKIRKGLAADGYLIVGIGNDSAVPVTNVTFTVSNGNGSRKVITRDVIQPGKLIRVATRVGPFTADEFQRIAVRVSSASAANR